LVLFRPAGLWQEGVVTIADSVMETVCNLEMDLEMVPVLGNNRTLNKLGEKMTIKNEKKIHGRGITSFFTTFGFLILATTGLILYLVPAGRIAEWVHWSLFGLTKSQWAHIHTLAGLMFLIAGGFHIYFNWKPLMKYLINKMKSGINLKKELYISLIISVLLMVAAAKEIPPFHYVFEFSEYLTLQRYLI
jgi:hypothetical protein